jgi:hypothetical protein
VEIYVREVKGKRARLSLDEGEEIATLSWNWWGGSYGDQIMHVELIEYIAFGAFGWPLD